MPYTCFVHGLGYEPAGRRAQSSHRDQEEPEAGQLLVAKVVAHPTFFKVQYVHKLLPSEKFSDLA